VLKGPSFLGVTGVYFNGRAAKFKFAHNGDYGDKITTVVPRARRQVR